MWKTHTLQIIFQTGNHGFFHFLNVYSRDPLMASQGARGLQWKLCLSANTHPFCISKGKKWSWSDKWANLIWITQIPFPIRYHKIRQQRNPDSNTPLIVSDFATHIFDSSCSKKKRFIKGTFFDKHGPRFRQTWVHSDNVSKSWERWKCIQILDTCLSQDKDSQGMIV